jgi:hypothetical protein
MADLMKKLGTEKKSELQSNFDNVFPDTSLLSGAPLFSTLVESGKLNHFFASIRLTFIDDNGVSELFAILNI